MAVDCGEAEVNRTRKEIEALQRRDAAAWDAFYQRHANEVYGFVCRLVCEDRPAAEDVFQTVWLEVIDRIEQFDPTGGGLRAWVFGIARRQIALFWRKRSLAQAAFAASRLECAHDGAILPDDVIERMERDAVVRAALLVLAPARRQVLTEKYVEGLSVRQIAFRAGKSPKSIESLLARSREEFRTLLRWYFANGVGGNEA